jgi:glycerol-3-phosphate cytidylyltransferase
MKKVVTLGTFDLLHYGHVMLLKRAKELGDYLIVGLSSDEFALFKGKKTYFNFEERKMILEAIKYVDEIFYVDSYYNEVMNIIQLKPDIFVIGDDYKGKFDMLQNFGIKVVYLKRTPEISSSQIKKDNYYD